jgi:hypothetical protein
MSRTSWSYHAYRLIEPDEQMDLFACREVRVHLIGRQLELGSAVDRTLCGGLLPARPLMREMDKSWLQHPRLCPVCRERVKKARRADQPGWRPAAKWGLV